MKIKRESSRNLPYRSGAGKPPPTFDQLLWRSAVLEARVILNLLHPPSVTRWN